MFKFLKEDKEINIQNWMGACSSRIHSVLNGIMIILLLPLFSITLNLQFLKSWFCPVFCIWHVNIYFVHSTLS